MSQAPVGASSGGDYQQRSETVTVSPSDTQVVINIQIRSDSILESDEHFSILITSSGVGVTVDPSTAEVTIIDASIGIADVHTSYLSGLYCCTTFLLNS